MGIAISLCIVHYFCSRVKLKNVEHWNPVLCRSHNFNLLLWEFAGDDSNKLFGLSKRLK